MDLSNKFTEAHTPDLSALMKAAGLATACIDADDMPVMRPAKHSRNEAGF